MTTRNTNLLNTTLNSSIAEENLRHPLLHNLKLYQWLYDILNGSLLKLVVHLLWRQNRKLADFFHLGRDSHSRKSENRIEGIKWNY